MQAFKVKIIFSRLTYKMLLNIFVIRVTSKTKPTGYSMMTAKMTKIDN